MNREVIIQPVREFLGDNGKETCSPVTWPFVVEKVALIYSGAAPVAGGWRHVSMASSTYLSWSPGWKILAASILRRHVFHLCWGIAGEAPNSFIQALKHLRLKLLLKLATVVAVNDSITRTDVTNISGRTAVLVPFVVDTEFFEFKPPEGRSDFAVVAGNNDRDEELVSQLARSGLRIVRLTSCSKVSAFHQAKGVANVDVRFKAPYAEWRDLYQKASAVLLPLSTCNHAAGQTAMLEAIACGAPVMIREGRAADVAGNFPTVMKIGSNSAEEWMHHYQEIVAGLYSRGVLSQTAKDVAARHHPDVVANVIVDALRQSERELDS